METIDIKVLLARYDAVFGTDKMHFSVVFELMENPAWYEHLENLGLIVTAASREKLMPTPVLKIYTGKTRGGGILVHLNEETLPEQSNPLVIEEIKLLVNRFNDLLPSVCGVCGRGLDEGETWICEDHNPN